MDKNKVKEENVNDITWDVDKTPIDLRDTFYSNGVKMLSSQYEFSLDFFEQPPRDDGYFEGIRLYVNPINFKLFTKLFNEQLEQYEKRFGEIKI